MARRKYKAQEVADALIKSRGLVSVAAGILDCDRTTVYRHIDKSATVKQAMEDAREASLDTAESKLLSQIDEGNTTAIIFFLKCIGKQRGYVERQEVTGEDGGPLQHAVKGYVTVSPDDWPDEESETDEACNEGPFQ